MPKINQYAVILFTLRDYIKTKSDTLKTLDKIAEIGYKAVQISGMAKGVMTEEEILTACNERGLTICGTHEPGVDILEDTDAVIERLKKLGTDSTAYPFPANIDLTDKQSVNDLINKLSIAGEKMAGVGISLLYHNHALEFYRVDGETVLDRIYNETNPKYLQAELDVHWITRGGANPIDWISKLKGRLPLLHIKDFSVTPDQEPVFAEIGNGNMNFPAIIKSAEEVGTKWFIVEQDMCPGDPFESIKMSFDYIESKLVW